VGVIPLAPSFPEAPALASLGFASNNIFRNITPAVRKRLLHFHLRQNSSSEINKFLTGLG
jgi:hypothetical protein